MWKKVDLVGQVPSVRNCVAAAATDSAFVIFGGIGRSEKERFNDIYAYSFADAKWHLVEASGDVPSPRYCCTLSLFEDKLVAFGGFDGDRLNTVHFLDTQTWDWKFMVTNGEIPEKRSHHTASLVGNRMIVYGGLSQEGKRLDDLHVLDLSAMTWSQPEIRGKSPSPRLGHISAVLNGNVLVVFGGYGGPEGHTKFSDINLLHFDTMTWTQPIVSAMYSHQAVSLGDKLLVFGGDNGAAIRNLSSDFYVFDLAKLRWSKINISGDIPPPRSHFGAAISGNKFLVFGGSGKGEQEKLNDLFLLDLDTVDMLREVSFDAIKGEVDHTIGMVMNEMNKILKDIQEKSGSKTTSEYKQARKVIDEKVNAAMGKMKGQFERLVSEKEKFKQWRVEQTKAADDERSRIDNEKRVVSTIVQTQSGRVILNVGGNRFDTSVATLVKDQNSMLAAMFSGRYSMKVEEDGSYFVDRDGSHFRYILNYLRDNTVSLPPNRQIHLELLREANFYQLVGLVEHIKSSLKKVEQLLEHTKEKSSDGSKKAAKQTKQVI